MEDLSPEDQAELDSHRQAQDASRAEREAQRKAMGPCADWQVIPNIVGDDGRAYQSLTVVLPRPAPQEVIEKIARAIADAARWDETTAAPWIADTVAAISPKPGDLPF